MPHCNLIKYALFASVHSYRGHLIHPMQDFSTTMALMQWRAESVQPSGLQNMMDLSDVNTGILLYGVSQYICKNLSTSVGPSLPLQSS